MVDRISSDVRRSLMRRIRGKNTKPEIIVRKFLFKEGYRYRLHQKNLPGCPDIVFRKLKKAIFVNGCFWHCHEGCPDFVLPKTRTDFWKQKLFGNKDRDIKNFLALENIGWKILVVWECDLKEPARVNELILQFVGSNYEGFLPTNYRQGSLINGQKRNHRI